MSDTTLDTLRTALAPKTGMRRIPWPTESYQHPSAPLSAKHLINVFAEQEPTDARSTVALISTPGLTVDQTLGFGPIRAMNSDMPGRLYVVSGNHLWRVRYPGGPEELGDVGVPDLDVLGNDSFMVTIAVGSQGAVVCVPPRAYTCDHFGPMNEMGGTFPGATSVAFLDGYYLFTATGDSALFFICRLLDPTNFDALDFAYSDAMPNVLRRVIAHRGEAWMCGEAGFEVWYDSGDVDFPFRRQAGGVIPVGITSAKSLARGDNSVWWVGTDNVVYRSNGYTPKRVSTHAIEAIIRVNDPGGISCALNYTQDGHTFYAITFGARTLVYDATTNQWADRSSSTDGSARWRPQAVSAGTNTLLFGDVLSGKLFRATPRQSDEDGMMIIRQATMPTLWGGTSRAECNRLEIEMEVGTEASQGPVQLEWSNDGGYTFPRSRTLSAGAVGAVRKRVFTTRLGSYRQRTFRITTHTSSTLYGVAADIVGPPQTSGG